MGTSLSHSTPVGYFHSIQASFALLLVSLCDATVQLNMDPKLYLNSISIVSGSISPKHEHYKLGLCIGFVLCTVQINR